MLLIEKVVWPDNKIDFTQFEDQNGIRFSFNVLPTNRIDANACSLPFGCIYTPLKQIPDHVPNQYDPVTCQKCFSFLNPYCPIDFAHKTWKCPICDSLNPLPASYHGMTQDCLAAELLPEFTTIEYLLKGAPISPPTFFFVVDTCMTKKEFTSLKTLLLQAIGILPHNTLVGFITFGNLINLHELRFSEYPHSYVFNGTKTYTPQQIKKYLSIGSPNGKIMNKLIIPMSEAEQMLTSIIDNLEMNQCFVEKGKRAQRCTGAALHLAVTIIETINLRSNAQILLFTGGPVTRGPGTMADLDRKVIVRQHRDIEAGNAQLSEKSKEFFTNLAINANKNNIVINLISASFEESGIHEMIPAVYQTGGFLLSNESFSEENIPKTLMKYIKGGVVRNSGANCLFTVRANMKFKISGCIGPCLSNNFNSPLVSNTKIGCGGTTQWRICGLMPQTTLAIYFDISSPKLDPIPSDAIAYIQFSTRYRHISTGNVRLRVTTCALRFADLKLDRDKIRNGIDQEAAAVLLAKQSMFNVKKIDSIDLVHLIDRQLVKFCSVFGDYTVNEPGSFQLPQNLQFLPQFIYHFRRSPFLSTFNSSPDQTSALRHALLCEDVTNSLFMVQPTLMKFSLDQPPTPVILDTASLRPDCVLLLDTYFRVLIWHGSTIAAWRNQGYQEQEEYQNLKAALEQPQEEAAALISERFPTPQFASCDQDSSLSRYLLARCNPSRDIAFDAAYTAVDTLSTDEPSFANFSAKLKQMASSP
ncbi:Protein transport protein sec23-1 [Tritrichomonas foetus]|uniref:Protein transport protein SEC23 n=1 Tax=Tritrichomonas foetus TaxID=1144522 RepID=A0A1J4JPN4_9EUKA|nr:Protein transport protein sec23-1 [Tritrichomonas foetus]|eukprot:OHS99228.1 Protein transport protein sec23-1 [Tritrichomonas foetus]